MEAIKAGLEKFKEAINAKTADDKLQEADNPNMNQRDRSHVQLQAEIAETKAAVHHDNAEIHLAKYVQH